MSGWLSMRATERPARPNRVAAVHPARLAPTMATSYSAGSLILPLRWMALLSGLATIHFAPWTASGQPLPPPTPSTRQDFAFGRQQRANTAGPPPPVVYTGGCRADGGARDRRRSVAPLRDGATPRSRGPGRPLRDR